MAKIQKIELNHQPFKQEFKHRKSVKELRAAAEIINKEKVLLRKTKKISKDKLKNQHSKVKQEAET